MISAVSAGLEFTSELNCLTSRLHFKLGSPGCGNILTSGLRFKVGFAGLRFPGYVTVTIHWPASTVTLDQPFLKKGKAACE